MGQDLRSLPKLRDSWSYLYVEHCKVDREDQAIALHDAEGKTPVPCASLTLLMLGPGTSITHAAVQALAGSGCLVAWTGEEGTRFYAQGLGESGSSAGIVRQALLCSNPALRLQVVLRMYRRRFPEPLPEGLTLQQVRGREGIRVREAYARASRETGVPWTGRSYDRSRWTASDPVNRALSAANACLYGLCHAAVVSLGYSPALGFIHTGKPLSLVYDVADLYKTETTIPAAFQAAATGQRDIEQAVRRTCRDLFVETRLLERIAEDLPQVLSAEGLEWPAEVAELEADLTAPGGIWDPQAGQVAGGVNYADLAAAGGEEGGGHDPGKGPREPARGTDPVDA